MLILLNKPFGVICQFSPHPSHPSLATLLSIPHVYPAGRLDTDSEGLLILTDDGQLQHQLSHPWHQKTKVYCVQVEGDVNQQALNQLRQGVMLKDGKAIAHAVEVIDEPIWLWQRHPPIRERRAIPTHWLRITLTEGRNRQVRRMTAAVGLPTLRLIRSHIGEYSLWDEAGQLLLPASYRSLESPALSSAPNAIRPKSANHTRHSRPPRRPRLPLSHS